MSETRLHPPRRRALVAAALLGLLVAPRVARMAAARVHYEDDNYLYSAYLIHRGQTPYRDFVQANPPLLEQLTAPLFGLFGATYRVGEGLSAVVVLALSLWLGLLGRRLHGPTAGLWAAALVAWTPLLFRYHLYEREVYSLAAVAAGLAVGLGGRPGGRTLRAAAAGALCGVAFHFKQDGAFAALALVLYWLGVRELRLAAAAAAGAALAGPGLLGLNLAWYGPDVLLQSFALHLIKGAPVPLGVRVARLAAELGPYLPVAAVGLWARRGEPATLLLVLWAGLELLFMLQISSTFWPHNMIPLLGPLVLLAGGALGAGGRLRSVAWAALLAGAVVLALQARGGVAARLGFLGVERTELQGAAAVVAAAVPAGSDALLCPPVVALEADRIKRFNYIDTLGFTRQLQAAYRAGTLRALLGRRGGASFSATLARANATWVPEALAAVRAREIRAVIPEGELPISREVLFTAGYRPVYGGSELVVMVPIEEAVPGR